MNVMVLDSVSAGYDGKPVLKDLSLTVAPGELLGLLGPNGAGKSTLFRVCTGTLAAGAGSISILGEDPRTAPPAAFARRVAYLPQISELPFSFTTEEVVAMGRFPHRGRFAPMSSRDQEVVNEALGLVDVVHLRGRNVNSLSGGERQRVLLAQALAQEPELLLLDEPAAHLDIQHQVELFELLGRIHDRGVTVFTIIHDLNLAAQYLDRLLFLREGRVVADGPPRDVLDADLIEQVFGIRLRVRDRDQDERPGVLYERLPGPDADGTRRKVHLLCGGGTGRALMRVLTAQGHAVSAGALNEGDSDEVLGRSLEVSIIRIPPFSPVDEEAQRKNTETACASDLVVVCPMAVGPGNMPNLQTALDAKDKGVPVAVLMPEGVSDHTGGQARALLDRILSAGGKPYPSLSALADAVHQL